MPFNAGNTEKQLGLVSLPLPANAGAARKPVLVRRRHGDTVATLKMSRLLS